MAGDWLPMRLDLADDISTVALSSRICHRIDTTVGALHRAWAWANRNTTDGRMERMTPKHLDEHVGIEGFAEAMAEVGWLIIEPNALVFPKYDVWNSHGAKTRLSNTRRQQLSRSCRASVTPVRDTSATTEEKRTEQRKTNTPPNPHASPVSGDASSDDARWCVSVPEASIPNPRQIDVEVAPSDPNATTLPTDTPSARVDPGASSGGFQIPPNIDLSRGVGGVVREIIRAYPANSGTIPGASVVRAATSKLSVERQSDFPTELHAAAWLLTRVQEWAQSSRCKSTEPRYRVSLAKWLETEAFDGGEDWNTPVPRANTSQRMERASLEYPENIVVNVVTSNGRRSER